MKMTNKELSEHMRVEHLGADYLHELQIQLDKELKKPVPEQDFDRIEDLTEAISVLNGTDHFISKRTAIGIDRVKANIHHNQHKKINIHRRWIAACIVAVLIGTNALSYKAYGMNAFSAAYQIVTGGIVIDFSKHDPTTSEARNVYAEEMQNLCSEHNIDARIPTYIPDGFSPTENYGSINDLDLYTSVSFYFQLKTKKLIIQMKYIKTDEVSIPFGIPSDQHNISEQVIDNTVVTVSKEDNQFTAAFMIDQIQYSICADGVDYDECQRILESFF
ncbi:MAG: hypothetical protein MJ071_08570 [Oscillospiraceae bacterium]|nr:hypothetical protein [Oscillospiraceae bacterium]